MNRDFDSDQDYYEFLAQLVESRDPGELSLEATPEGEGLGIYTIEDWLEDERARDAMRIQFLLRYSQRRAA
jgi:hypothetical protein